MSHGEERFHERKRAVNTKEEEHDEKEANPVLSSRECTEGNGPAAEDETEGCILKFGNILSLQHGEVAESCEYGKSSNKTKHGIGDGYDTTVQERRFIGLAKRPIGSHDTKRDSQTEEYLRHRRTPNGRLFRQNLPIRIPNVNVNPILGALQRDRPAQEHEEQNNRQSHGEVRDAAGPLDAECDAEKDDDPGEERVADVLPHHARGSEVVAEGGHANDFVVEVSLRV
mmetsp:Transcript_21183/g.45964  ORF Transcript_21183/g.45964 Transcript_21183/m.45964 type:complete len:227 (+) Transcript_21183:776-1456(+)